MKEKDIDPQNSTQIRDFAQKIRTRADYLMFALQMERGIAEKMLARLFLATGDRRFAPTTEAHLKYVKKYASEFGRKPSEFSIDNEMQEWLQQTADKFEQNRVLIKLLKKYQIGKPMGEMQKTAFSKHLRISRSNLSYYERFVFSIAEETKIKLFLAFGHPAFAPSDEEEENILQQLAPEIKLLPFVNVNDFAHLSSKTAKVCSPVKTKLPEVKQTTTDNSPNVQAVIKALIGSDDFWRELKNRAGSLEKQNSDQVEVKTEFVDTEVASAEFLQETDKMIKYTTARIQALAQMGNRREMAKGLKPALDQLEKSLATLFLNVRALRKTETGKGFLEILRQEGTFLNLWDPKEESDGEND